MLGAVVIMTALTAASPPALAQESPAITPTVEAAETDPGELVPDQLGGFEAEVTVTRGREHLEGLDPDDPSDAATLAELGSLLAASGRPVDDLTTALAFVSTDELFAFVVALRIAGAPDGSILPAYLPLLLDDLEVTRQGPAQLAGREVLVVHADGGEGEVALHVLGVGDTVWIVQGPEDVVTTVLEGLPPG